MDFREQWARRQTCSRTDYCAVSKICCQVWTFLKVLTAVREEKKSNCCSFNLSLLIHHFLRTRRPHWQRSTIWANSETTASHLRDEGEALFCFLPRLSGLGWWDGCVCVVQLLAQRQLICVYLQGMFPSTDRLIKESSRVWHAHDSRCPPPLSSCWFKYQLNSLNIPIKARDKSCVMYAPSCSSLLFATHSTSSLPLGAKFTWEIKNLLSLDPIDIWASISEIITASGQYPATFRSRCDDGLGGAGGSVATWSSRKGAVLCLGGCVHFWVCVFVSFRLRCTVHTLSHRVCRDGSVEVWKTDFVPFVSRRAAPLVLLGWRYEESQWGKKRHSSL